MNKRLLNLVIRTYELKGAAYQVMLALAWNSSGTNECSISISGLASAAHLTKQAVIRALHSLSAPDATTEGRSILTRVRKGRGTGMPATYLINIDLMRDLNRRRRYRLATEPQQRGTGVILIPGVDRTSVSKTGSLSALVEHPLTRTLTGEISPTVIAGPGTSSPASKPFSQREVNKILKAHVKRVAKDIAAMVNGSKEIVPIIEEALPSEVVEVAAPSHDGNKADTKLGELTSGAKHILERQLGGISSQRSYRSVSPLSSKGVQVLPVDSYPGAIRWPRRVR
jgi:hypothetical protein